MLRLDHLAVSALQLADGVEAVEAALGVRLGAVGQHPHMATHNRLVGMGDLYLEVIAADPDQPKPSWPRWFDLDNFAGPPRLTNWIAGSNNLTADLNACPKGTGVPVDLARADYRWRMAVPADGKLPFDGAFPALIEWQGDKHPTQALPDVGLSLIRLELAHPQAEDLRAALTGLMQDPRVVITAGPLALRATVQTPHGVRVLE